MPAQFSDYVTQGTPSATNVFIIPFELSVTLNAINIDSPYMNTNPQSYDYTIHRDNNNKVYLKTIIDNTNRPALIDSTPVGPIISCSNSLPGVQPNDYLVYHNYTVNNGILVTTDYKILYDNTALTFKIFDPSNNNDVTNSVLLSLATDIIESMKRALSINIQTDAIYKNSTNKSLSDYLAFLSIYSTIKDNNNESLASIIQNNWTNYKSLFNTPTIDIDSLFNNQKADIVKYFILFLLFNQDALKVEKYINYHFGILFTCHFVLYNIDAGLGENHSISTTKRVLLTNM